MARKKASGGPVRALLTILIVLLAVFAGMLIYLVVDTLRGQDPDRSLQEIPTVPSAETVTLPPAADASTAPPPTQTEPPHVVATATLLSTGDILMHKPVIDTHYHKDTGYDFTPIFRFIRDRVSRADLAVANLETTTAGTARPYQGTPAFNCPDEIVTALKDAGFDMLLTANNHCFDTGIDGYQRTLQVVHDAGLDSLGTMTSAEDPKYRIKDLNGIRVGMICYTYETSGGGGSYPAFNGLPMYGGSYDMVNTYTPRAPERMYGQLEQYLAEMKAAGAEVTVMEIHWGPEEFKLSASEEQQAMAQKFCDLGFDVVVGGHPHVVQPVDLLTSTADPEHKTVVLYSMGNAVSNQRTGAVNGAPAGYTEDGILFSVTFEKWSDGAVRVSGAEAMPTWVKRIRRVEYSILPLDMEIEDQWADLYDLDAAMLKDARASYKRTMDLVGEGMEKCQTWFDETSRDAAVPVSS